jgi:anti-sigma factor RsiW
MTGQACSDMRLLIQADADGELGAAEAAQVVRHLQDCADCRAVRGQLAEVSTRLRAEATRYPAPPSLQDAVRARIAAVRAVPPANENRREMPVARRPFSIFAAGAGVGIAACLAVLLVAPTNSRLPDELVASHIRALQPGHLIDVVSTDQHTVKPWFDGRLDYAPPVKDFAAAGFPLAGGRLDYVAHRPVAALIYHRRLHVIDLYVWPDGGHVESAAQGGRDGYNFAFWQQGGMNFRAVSDVNAGELADFERLWQVK